MSDVTVLFDHGIGAREAVHHHRVLDIRAGTYDDAPQVAAQASARCHVDPGTDDDVANHHRAWMNKGAGIDDRDDTVVGIDLSHAP